MSIIYMKKIFTYFSIFWLGIFISFTTFIMTWNSQKSYISKTSFELSTAEKASSKQAVFAWGCFWCMEGIFEAQDGVYEAISGYIWGSAESASYTEVSSWMTKHREAVQVLYNPEVISYERLVELYWTQIDPTDNGGQFADRWFHYTTAIYYTDEKEKTIAEISKQNLENSWKFEKSIATLILPLSEFFPAESYHQDYYKKSSFRYNLYKRGSGREGFIEENWKDRIAELSEATYSEEALREKLTPLQYSVTQEWATERAFQNEYWDNKEAGIYVDIIDGTPLYSSLDKFDSGTGWPSFTRAISEDVIETRTDRKFFMTRTEAVSASSNAHLGHIFPDAPPELWGIRHCINSASLRFIPLEKLEEEGYGEYRKLFE